MRLKTEKSPSAGPAADEIAVAVLTWLAGEPDMLSRFLALTGLDASSLRAMSGNRGFKAGLLEFVLAHQPSLMAFSAHSGIAPEAVAAAWEKLGGHGGMEA